MKLPVMISNILENLVLNSEAAVRNSFCWHSTRDAIIETWGKISWVMEFMGVNYFLSLSVRFGVTKMGIKTQKTFDSIFLECPSARVPWVPKWLSALNAWVPSECASDCMPSESPLSPQRHFRLVLTLTFSKKHSSEMPFKQIVIRF